ncbi:MAG: UvrD-helicase domain-containing protein [Candidatus Omnitrophota bacterium]
MVNSQDKILEKLNPQQKKAIAHGKGPLLIIAGAGTGKTAVITRRIAYLIQSKQAKPEEILALTFTDKAAIEMQERVDVLVPYGFTDTWIQTFHAFGDRILKEKSMEIGLTPDFKVLTKPEAVVFFQEHIFDFPLDYYRPLSNPTKFIMAMLTLFSRAKDEDVSPDEYINYAKKLEKQSLKNIKDQALAEEAAKQLEIASCYKRYQELLAQEGKVDFGNQFFLTLQLFRKRPSILKYYQKQFKFILVDEFQDTNYAQFEIVKLLAASHKNLTVVADDDQSIYKWRGAAVSNILNFIKTYPKAKKIPLTKNYRSTQAILDSAYGLIQNNNPDRLEVQAKINKQLIGKVKGGQSPRHLHFDTVSSEADEVAKVIKEKVESGKYNYEDFAVLVRSNSDADPFLKAFNMHSLPWRFSGNQGLYSREEVRLCIAFLRLIASLNDSLSLYYLASSEIYKLPIVDLTLCMNYSSRRKVSLFGVFQSLDRIEELKSISGEARATVEKIVKDIVGFLKTSRDHTTGRLLYKFLTESGYIKKLVKNPSLVNEEKIKNIAKFFEMVRNFEIVAREDRVIYFVNYLDMLVQAGDDPATVEADLDISAINVFTIHKAKGLEFDVVFLVSLVMGKFPWPRRHETLEFPVELIKDILPSGDFHIQEERRLFYVGMTRAKKELFLTSARDYGTKKTRKISKFVLESLGSQEEQVVHKVDAIEAIERHAPKPESKLKTTGVIPDEQILNLSYYQIDDYLTCPLKYKYVHILRVPILEHQVVIYGKAMHDAVQRYNQNRIRKVSTKLDEIIAVFEDSFRPEGFLSQEHYKQRLSAGKRALEDFFKIEKKNKVIPSYIEKEFSFLIDNIRIVGRWDRIDKRGNEEVVIDFKTSEVKKQKDADEKTKKSLQLDIYSLAYQKIFNNIPDWVELYFLESQLIGRAKKSQKDIDSVIDKIETAAKGIRSGSFGAKPAYLACNFCAYSQICPAAVLKKY